MRHKQKHFTMLFDSFTTRNSNAHDMTMAIIDALLYRYVLLHKSIYTHSLHAIMYTYLSEPNFATVTNIKYYSRFRVSGTSLLYILPLFVPNCDNFTDSLTKSHFGIC